MTLYNQNLLKDTTILMVSDHGTTLPSVYYLNDFFQIESKLPMLFILVNDRKNVSYYDQYYHIQQNQQTFITGYDFYNTVANLLYGDKYIDIKNKTDDHDTPKSPKGESLFNYIDPMSRHPKNYENMDSVRGTDNEFITTQTKVGRIDNIEEGKVENVNELPYSKAITIDNRNVCLIFYSFIIEKLELISILCNDAKIKSILFSEYILVLLINFFFNALLYSDVVVSNKYHNNGKLDFAVSLLLSIIANIITSILCYYLKYSRGIEERMRLILEIKYKVRCYRNIKKLISFLRIKFICFFISQLIIVFICLYYVVIFCVIYSNSQKSLLVN